MSHNIVQIAVSPPTEFGEQEGLYALTSDGKVLYGLWGGGKFTWQADITPPDDMINLPWRARVES